MSASASLAMTHLVTFAEVDQNKVTPGVLGFIVFAAMALVVWRLMRSMNKHMGRVDFQVKTEEDASGAAGKAGEKGPGSVGGTPKAQRG